MGAHDEGQPGSSHLAPEQSTKSSLNGSKIERWLNHEGYSSAGGNEGTSKKPVGEGAGPSNQAPEVATTIQHYMLPAGGIRAPTRVIGKST